MRVAISMTRGYFGRFAPCVTKVRNGRGISTPSTVASAGGMDLGHAISPSTATTCFRETTETRSIPDAQQTSGKGPVGPTFIRISPSHTKTLYGLSTIRLCGENVALMFQAIGDVFSRATIISGMTSVRPADSTSAGVGRFRGLIAVALDAVIVDAISALAGTGLSNAEGFGIGFST